MPSYVGFQLALELSSVLPIKEYTSLALTSIVDLARNLRNSGSDIVVESDLADIFGRAQISDEVVKSFKDKVRTTKLVPLYNGSEIQLQSGPGPTVIRAFQEPRYFATVVTLSLFSYFLPKRELARMLASSMLKRFEANLPGAKSPCGYDGIESTLTAITNQCSEFHWGSYRERVEQKVKASFPEYHWAADYILLTPAVLVGAMDFFYIAKSLPENRIVTLSSQTGFLLLVVWAHYLLELNVVITGLPNSDIVFGNIEEPQVIIHWNKDDDKQYAYHGPWGKTETLGPIIRLHEKDMHVILSSEPEENDIDHLDPYERHPLSGYGAIYLRRTLNTQLIIQDNNPVYEDLVGLIAGLAFNKSQRMRRKYTVGYPDEPNEGITSGEVIKLEKWRLMKSMSLIFTGIRIDERKCLDYASALEGCAFSESFLPSTLDVFLKSNSYADFYSSPEEAFETNAYGMAQHVEFMARIVLAFAHVIELDQCGDMPLILDHEGAVVVQFLDAISTSSSRDTTIRPGSLATFDSIASLLGSFEESDHHYSGPEWLRASHGWSVHLNTVGEHDPAKVRLELVHVRKGIPTNPRTNERKLWIRDGVGVTKGTHNNVYPIERDSEYLPRACAKFLEKQEYWVTGVQEFELTLHLTFALCAEWQSRGADPKISEINGYRRMHDRLWNAFVTPECQHSSLNQKEQREKIKLGPDAAALLGYDRGFEVDGEGSEPEKVWVLLTKGDRYLRWTAIENVVPQGEECSERRTMVRSNKCCESCALEYTASHDGKWFLVL